MAHRTAAWRGNLDRPGVPNFPQILLRRVAERVVTVAADGEGRDAARQGASVGGEMHQRSRTPAGGPRAVVLLLEAGSGFGRARGVGCHPERSRDFLRCFDRPPPRLLRALEERVARRGLAVANLVEDEALQMYLRDANLCASRTNSGNWSTVSLRPVSQSETRGVVAPTCF